VTVSFDPRRGLVIVDAQIHGPVRSVRARMLVDTGSAITMLRPATLTAAGYDLAQPRSRIRIAAVSGILDAPLFIVDRLTAIDQAWSGVAILGHPLPGGLPFTGLLGANVLRNRRLLIDYRAGTVRLE
jgi:predicted aspartyl protease